MKETKLQEAKDSIINNESATPAKLGNTLNFIRWPEYVTASVLIIIAMMILSYLFFGTYTKKIELPGWLVAADGQTNVYTEYSGYVSALWVKEQQNVEKGQKLFEITQLSNAGTAIRKVITAPHGGVVFSLLLKVQQPVLANDQAMSILAKNAKWEAVFYANSQQYNTIQINTSAELRYDAFPYQNFGTYTGNVISIAQTPLQADSLIYPLPNKGRAGTYYKIRIALEKQCINIQDKCQSFHPGMKATANIHIGSRSLIAWLFYSKRSTQSHSKSEPSS